jgi:hypothetical protein
MFGCHDCALGRFGAGLVPITTWPAGANRRDNCAPGARSAHSENCGSACVAVDSGFQSSVPWSFPNSRMIWLHKCE